MFDKADSDRIRQSLLEYERAAEAEWPLVASSQAYPEADNALQRLYAAYQQVQRRNDTQQKFLVILSEQPRQNEHRTHRTGNRGPHRHRPP
ncbi:MAG: hypothetical protein QOC62_2803 [Mycobacterium sp.]|nr:hypothetical protein [Mycobacterium sp.]